MQYAHLLKENNIKGSMSKKATPNDNVVIESFFASLKKNAFTVKFIKLKKMLLKILNSIHFLTIIIVFSLKPV